LPPLDELEILRTDREDAGGPECKTADQRLKSNADVHVGLQTLAISEVTGSRIFDLSVLMAF
jgi:hypothetical protein